jgi:RNA polymerase sigma factor (sigma-70 family)
MALCSTSYNHPSWHQQIIRHVVANKGTSEDGEEIFFEALTALDRNLREGKFEGRSTLNTYFFEIAKRRWLKHLAQRRPDLRLEDAFLTDEMNLSVERLFIIAEHEHIFSEIMTHISERCQRIFALFHLGYNMAEIAEE